jgi:hypothetical protein
MKSKVVVVADPATGGVINVSENNPEWGYVKVQQTVIVVDKSIATRRVRTALINAQLIDLELMDFHAGQQLDGRIVVEESLIPFNKTNPNRDLKVAGSTGIPCTINGQNIYRRTYFTTKESAKDVEIAHDNVEELRAEYARSVQTNTLKPNEEFSIAG